jgi:hypothetical protein
VPERHITSSDFCNVKEGYVSFYFVRLLDVMTAPDTTTSTSADRKTVEAAVLNAQFFTKNVLLLDHFYVERHFLFKGLSFALPATKKSRCLFVKLYFVLGLPPSPPPHHAIFIA